MPNPTPFKQIGGGGYHDFYVGYDPATQQDKFYGAGLGGYSVWDVTQPETPKQLFTITSLGMDIAHTFTPSPDGRYAVTETEYQYTPLRIWDLERRPAGQDAEHRSSPISAWTADWRDLSHNHEVRWPYVFVSAYEDGLQVFDLKDPKHPKTDGAWFTCECEHEHGFGGTPDNGWQSTNERRAGRVRRRRPQLRRTDRPLRHAQRACGCSRWTASTAGTATTTACRTSRACRTGITARKARRSPSCRNAATSGR